MSLYDRETFNFIKEPDNNLLNSRKELISKCRHSNKFMLKKNSLKFIISDLL